MTLSARRLLARAARVGRGALNLTVYPLVARARRDRKRWAFGHQDDLFGGNAKYLYLWASLHRPDIEAVWITGDRALRDRLRAAGHRAELRWSPAGMRHAVRSGAHFFGHSASDVNLLLSNGAKLVNLWHGVGLKPIQHNDPRCVVSTHAKYRHNPLTRALFLDYVVDPDIVVATSPFMREHFADQFRLPEARCPELGYPRLDASADARLKQAVRALDEAAGASPFTGEFSEHYIYMPTFRDTERPFLEEALPNMERFSAILAARNAVLYVKLHPKTRDAIPARYGNIKPWPAALDVYCYLADFDGLISDYSSVLYDYVAVKDTGAVVYTFDYESYLAGDRGLLYDFGDLVPGVWANSFDELCDALRDGAALVRAPDDRYDRVRALFWGGSARPASPAVARYVEEMG